MSGKSDVGDGIDQTRVPRWPDTSFSEYELLASVRDLRNPQAEASNATNDFCIV